MGHRIAVMRKTIFGGIRHSRGKNARRKTASESRQKNTATLYRVLYYTNYAVLSSARRRFFGYFNQYEANRIN